MCRSEVGREKCGSTKTLPVPLPVGAAVACVGPALGATFAAVPPKVVGETSQSAGQCPPRATTQEVNPVARSGAGKPAGSDSVMKLYRYIRRTRTTDIDYGCTAWRRTAAMAARMLSYTACM